MSHPGFFLVLEGPEAAGKSTLARGIAGWMREQGVDPVMVREPGGTPVAEALRQEVLLKAREWTPAMELLYIATARADLVTNVIRPALAEGRTLISDRFDLSTIAYQGAGRMLPITHVRWVNQSATGGLKPDLTLVLDVDADVAVARQRASAKGLDRVEREGRDFHQRVAEAYRAATGTGVYHLDGDAPPEQVLSQAWELICAARPQLFRPHVSTALASTTEESA